MKLTQECGQRWYRPRSWRATRYRLRLLGPKRYRVGVAFGPVMLFWRFE